MLHLHMRCLQLACYVYRDVGVCKHCNTKLEGTPVQLPCKHRICDKCYTQEARVNSQCPDCRKQIPQDFDPEQFCCFDKYVCFIQSLYLFVCWIINALVLFWKGVLEVSKCIACSGNWQFCILPNFSTFTLKRCWKCLDAQHTLGFDNSSY